MKVNNIYIENFKGFEKERFSFNENFTVLIGENGAGKSSILEALSFLLGTFFLGVDGIPRISIKQSDKRRVLVSRNSLEVKLPLKLSIEHTLNEKKYSWFRDTNKVSGGSTSYKHAGELIAHIRELTDAVREGEKVDLPLIAYYGVERLCKERHEKKSFAKQSSRFDGYLNALDPRSTEKKFLEWFKTLEASILQEHEIPSFDKQLYTAITSTIANMANGWTDVYYNLKQDDIVGKNPDGSWTTFSMLSDGYRGIVRLAADIASRAIKLNPHLGEEAVKQTSGVVLIDEIDMHLHPKWQKNIVTDLKRTFPNIQFIVTTHSPFIVQSLKADEVINLDDRPIDENPDTLSIEDNAALMGVTEVMSKDFSQKEATAIDYLKLLDSEPTQEVLEQLNELISSTTDPAFKAKLQMERLSKFGK